MAKSRRKSATKRKRENGAEDLDLEATVVTVSNDSMVTREQPQAARTNKAIKKAKNTDGKFGECSKLIMNQVEKVVRGVQTRSKMNPSEDQNNNATVKVQTSNATQQNRNSKKFSIPKRMLLNDLELETCDFDSELQNAMSFQGELEARISQTEAEVHADDFVTDLDETDVFEEEGVQQIQVGDGINTEVEAQMEEEGDELSEIDLGGSAANKEENEQGMDIEKLASDPKLLKALDAIVNKKVDQQMRIKEVELRKSLQEINTPTATKKGKKTDGKGKVGELLTQDKRIVRTVKSPSDTTLYAPALQNLMITTPDRGDRGELIKNSKIGNTLITDKIADFVGAIRLEQEGQGNNTTEDPLPGTSGWNAPPRDTLPAMPSAMVIPGRDEARERADKMLLEAERFKADHLNNPGMYQQENEIQTDLNMLLANAKIVAAAAKANNTVLTGRDDHSHAGNNFPSGSGVTGNLVGNPYNSGLTGLTDDDFFHLTCHIDQSLREKIEKGAYVDLEKLLPKERGNSFGGAGEDGGRLEWVRRDGHTFLAPVNDKGRIFGFRKWEQAFRTYATIYCGANPNRSKEIWQYISVISTAASSFIWENVANYDFTFRHLMQFNPQRSWAVTYTQMWNLSMRDPLPKNNFNNRSSFNGTQGNKGSQNQTTGRKPKYCWSFNRNEPCKFGKNCKFIERCSFCDATSHGVISCHKANGSANGRKEGKAFKK